MVYRRPPLLPDEDPDLGEPIGELAGYEQSPDQDLIEPIRRSVARRVLAADVADLALVMPGSLAVTYLAMLMAPVLGRTAPPSPAASFDRDAAPPSDDKET